MADARDIEVELPDWQTERGCAMIGDRVRGRLYTPTEGADAPLVVVLGGISATRFVADAGPGTARGWWSRLVHPGGAIDLNRMRVLGFEFGPNEDALTCPETITTADQARRLKALLDAHDLGPVAALVGSSYGGMCGLAFARDYPEDLGRLCLIGAAHKPYPIGVGWRGIQRRVVRLALDAGRPEDGLKLARELAMTTYRTPEEFADRFALDETASGPPGFDICDYLANRGDAFAARTNAQRFLALSESIDLHRIEPETVTTSTLIMGAISDQLAPLPTLRELRDRLAGESELYTFTSLYGHDAFLKEYDQMEPALARFMAQALADAARSGRVGV